MSAISVPDRASTWWADSVVPSARCGSSSDEQPLEAEHQRVVAPPLDRGLARGRASSSGERGVQRSAAGAVLRERGGGVLSVEHEGLAREFLGALQIVAGNRRGFGHGASFSHGKAVLGKGKRRAELLVQESAGHARRAPPLSMSPASGDGPGPWGTLGVDLLQHTDDRNGLARLCHPSPACAALASATRAASRSPAAARDERLARRPARTSSTAAATPSRRASQKERGTPVVVNKWASWCGPAGSSSPTSGTRRTSARARSSSSA